MSKYWWIGSFYDKKLKKKLKGGTLWDFSTSILSQNSKKMKRGILWEKISWKKVSQCWANWKGDPFVSSGNVCYEENLFGVFQTFEELLGEEPIWLFQIYRKKYLKINKNTDEKPYCSRFFSLEKRRLPMPTSQKDTTCGLSNVISSRR